MLPLPEFHDPHTVGHVWRVPYEERARQARDWAQRHDIRPATSDARRIGLLLIDCQNTFCIPGFELFVAGPGGQGNPSGQGAVDDNRRLCAFIYRHLDLIAQIVPTLDTHRAMQIFHGAFLVDERGHPPAPWTAIALADVESGKWRASPAAEALAGTNQFDVQRHLVHYCRDLERRGKYALMIWPYHAMLGGIGHALVSAVEEACFFHAQARQSPTRFEIKGENPFTENYSALSAEVRTGADGQPIADRPKELIDALLAFDMLIVAGQAKSHCVAWTVADLLAEIESRDASLAKKVYLLEDCTSSVVAPGADFTAQADAAFERFAMAGMNLVRSTTPLADWPVPT
jgi:nicotinamidase-related amidase